MQPMGRARNASSGVRAGKHVTKTHNQWGVVSSVLAVKCDKTSLAESQFEVDDVPLSFQPNFLQFFKIKL